MERKENLKLVRIFIGESDKYKHKALYEEVVFLLRGPNLPEQQSHEELWDSGHTALYINRR